MVSTDETCPMDSRRLPGLCPLSLFFVSLQVSFSVSYIQDPGTLQQATNVSQGHFRRSAVRPSLRRFLATSHLSSVCLMHGSFLPPSSFSADCTWRPGLPFCPVCLAGDEHMGQALSTSKHKPSGTCHIFQLVYKLLEMGCDTQFKGGRGVHLLETNIPSSYFSAHVRRERESTETCRIFLFFSSTDHCEILCLLCWVSGKCPFHDHPWNWHLLVNSFQGMVHRCTCMFWSNNSLS